MDQIVVLGFIKFNLAHTLAFLFRALVVVCVEGFIGIFCRLISDGFQPSISIKLIKFNLNTVLINRHLNFYHTPP